MPHQSEVAADLGAGLSLEFQLSPGLSWHSEFNYFPQTHLQTSQDGGNTLSFSSGLKANFLQRRRFAVYGEMRPGFVSFSDVPVETPEFSIAGQRKTHFSFNFGGGLEYYPSLRTV